MEEDIIKMISNEKIVGGYNDIPPNVKQLTEKEFAQSRFFNYSPYKVEFRQLLGKYNINGIKLQNIHIYWFSDGYGIILMSDFWGGKVYYFECYICNHDFINLENRMCYTKSKCKKCGYIQEIDSSD